MNFEISSIMLYGLHERVTWETVTPKITKVDQGEPKFTLVFEG